MPVIKTVFACEFCDKIYRHKSSAKKHEEKCFCNPERRACKTCRHCERAIDDNGADGDFYQERKFWWCNLFNKELVHPDKPIKDKDKDREIPVMVSCNKWEEAK